MTLTDWLQVSGFAVVIVTSVLGYLSTRSKVAGVHKLVNSQHDDLIARDTQLTNALTDAGVKLPANPSKPVLLVVSLGYRPKSGRYPNGR